MFLAIASSGRHSAHDDDQLSGVAAPLCWLDPCAEERRTVAHTRDCEAVSTLELPNWPTAEGGCTRRYSHDSLRTNYISKLTTAYERKLGVTHDRNGTLRTGSPMRNDVVTQYMAFVREEWGKVGAKVPHALARLCSHLTAIHRALALRLRHTQDPYDRAVSHGYTPTTVAFSTTNRGDGLSRTLIRCILRPQMMRPPL